MTTDLYVREFEKDAVAAMQDRFAPAAPVAELSRLVAAQEAAAAGGTELSAEARLLQGSFVQDGIVLGRHIAAATGALQDRWGPALDLAPSALRDRLHVFVPDTAGTAGPFVYTTAWGLIDGGTGGAGIGSQTNLRNGTMSASHFTHGTNGLSAYAGVGMSIVPTLPLCTLSVRPVVNWSGFDLLSHRIFDPQLHPQAWGVAGAEIGVHVQSRDLNGGAFRNDGGRWETAWHRSEINPSGSRLYNDSMDARDLLVDVLATSQRRYVIWVSCRALVSSQARFGLDIWASASVSCQVPFVIVEQSGS